VQGLASDWRRAFFFVLLGAFVSSWPKNTVPLPVTLPPWFKTSVGVQPDAPTQLKPGFICQ
jgi:hypothetical protein